MTESTERLSSALADRYQILNRLGEGGMATVYLAEDLKHKRQVAVKVLKPELAAVLGAERFVQEITTTASLQHPHILPLFDSGEADSFLYYVMPYIEGETLRSKLDRETQLGIDEAVRITAEVADALDYAHRHGVIHRDIKPENILLHDGRPMVADFGIALAVSAAAGGRMTETGLSLGTPHYMSPEQATAEKEITARSDVYSLGSVLYEMLAGAPPHLGGSAQQIIMKIIAEDAPPVTTLRKSVPPNVDAAVSMSLEKLPADRFDSAKAFAEALGNTAFTTSVMAERAPAARAYYPSTAVKLHAVTTALLAITLAWALTRPTPAQPVTRYGLALPADQAAGARGFGAITPNGTRIIYSGPSASTGFNQLWVKNREMLVARPVPGTDGASALAISPDGTRLVVVIQNELRMLSLDGGFLTTLSGGASGASGSVTWLEDGTLVYLARDRFALEQVSEAGGRAATTLWQSDSLFPQNVSAIPDSRGLLFQACLAPCAQGDLYVLEFGEDSARLLVPNARAGVMVDDMLFFSETRPGGGASPVYAVGMDQKTLTIRGDPVLVADSVQSPGGQPYFAISSSGTGIMMRGGRGATGENELVWVDQAGRETPVDSSWRFRVTQFAADYGWALSPDDRRLAIGLNTRVGDDIWLKQLPHGAVSRVTFGASPDRRPRWRPDGRWLTFLTDTSFSMRRADGTGSDSIIWMGRADEGLLSPDGRWIVLRMGATSAAAGGRDMFVMRVGEDTVPRPLLATPFDEMSVELSPDGRWIAYQSDETGRPEVFLRPFPNVGDGKVQVSSEGGTGPLWSRNGREFYYLRRDEMMMAVPIAPDGTPRAGDQREMFRRSGPLADLNAVYYTPWDVAADGRFIMTRSVTNSEAQPAMLVVVENWLDEVRRMVQP
jgi:Tol biopolymer transport system component/tRNA A-37 threonylcarbamoyl transferase component Bud32